MKHGQATWWGDLNHIETRYVYHQLLPRQLLEDAQARKQDLCVEDLARAACMARHAARIYARERSSLPLRLLAGVSYCPAITLDTSGIPEQKSLMFRSRRSSLCMRFSLLLQLYDGFRHLQSFGRWSWTGMTYEEVWAKYDRKIREELGGNDVDERELSRMISLRILHKACQTNPHIDKFAEIERAHEILSRAAAWDRSLPSSSSSAAAMGGHLRPLFEYMNKVAQTSQVAGA